MPRDWSINEQVDVPQNREAAARPAARRLEGATDPDGIMPPVDRQTWLTSLRRTRNSTMSKLASLFGANDLSPDFWDDLEAALILADFGPKATQSLIEDLKSQASENAVLRASDLQAMLRRRMVELAESAYEGPQHDPTQPYVVLVVGVNGSGKTTVVARLAHLYRRDGKRVLMAAADTYRAAATEQLARWAKQLEVEIVAGAPGSDPGAVVYQAGETARRSRIDVLIVDTSGRMHTSHNLMAELEKIRRVAAKVIPGAPDEVLLVLDATTGQNGLSQARGFMDAVEVTGVVVTKLDTSARGGAALGVGSELGLPIRYVGHGEGLDDLSPFDAVAYVDGLIPEFAAADPQPLRRFRA
jgi:fused signal recognition particle receptor